MPAPIRVLVLRPEPQAGRMAAELAARGLDPLVMPMLSVAFEPGVVGRVLAAGEDPPGALAFTSAHGVDAAAADPSFAEVSGIPVHAVGPATAEAARRAGFADVRETAGDGKALLRHLLETIPPGIAIVHVAGRDQALDLAAALKAEGRSARTVVAYRAEASAALPSDFAAALAGGTIDIAVVASRRTAASFCRAVEASGVPTPLRRPVVVAISAAAGDPLRGIVGEIVIAPHPEGGALTEAVVALAAALANNGEERRG